LISAQKGRVAIFIANSNNNISLQNILKRILLGLLSKRDCIFKVRTLLKHFLTWLGIGIIY